MEKNTDTSNMRETSDTIKKNLDKVGMLVKEFRQTEQSLLPIIKTYCEKIIDDADFMVYVYFAEADGVLNSEQDLEICIELRKTDLKSACLYLDRLNEIQKLMGNVIPWMETNHNVITLEFNCQAIVHALGGDLDNWHYGLD